MILLPQYLHKKGVHWRLTCFPLLQHDYLQPCCLFARCFCVTCLWMIVGAMITKMNNHDHYHPWSTHQLNLLHLCQPKSPPKLRGFHVYKIHKFDFLQLHRITFCSVRMKTCSSWLSLAARAAFRRST